MFSCCILQKKHNKLLLTLYVTILNKLILILGIENEDCKYSILYSFVLAVSINTLLF